MHHTDGRDLPAFFRPPTKTSQDSSAHNAVLESLAPKTGQESSDPNTGQNSTAALGASQVSEEECKSQGKLEQALDLCKDKITVTKSSQENGERKR